jgi:hypothetical protein
MCKISGQDREGLVVDDTLLLQVPLLHLPSPLIGFLLDLFHSFYYDAPLLRRYGQRDCPLAWAADCTVHPFSPLVNSMAHHLRAIASKSLYQQPGKNKVEALQERMDSQFADVRRRLDVFDRRFGNMERLLTLIAEAVTKGSPPQNSAQ